MKENVKFPLLELGHCQIKENLQHFYNFSSIVIFNPEHVETPCIQNYISSNLHPKDLEVSKGRRRLEWGDHPVCWSSKGKNCCQAEELESLS